MYRPDIYTQRRMARLCNEIGWFPVEKQLDRWSWQDVQRVIRLHLQIECGVV